MEINVLLFDVDSIELFIENKAKQWQIYEGNLLKQYNLIDNDAVIVNGWW